MRIRKEEPKDYESIASTVKQEFDGAEHSDGNEHELVNALRNGTSYIPELALAPLAVLPKYQKQGIGTALIKEGHRIANESGYVYSIVLGSEEYYPRAGYLPAENFGIKPPFDVPSANFMAYRLNEAAPDIKGVLQYAEEFGIEE